MVKTTDTSETYDLRSILNSWIQNWYWFIISIIVCLSAAYLYVCIRSPKYEVRASVLVNTSDDNSSFSEIALSDILGTKGKVDDEVFIISSHAVLTDVARDLGLNRVHYLKNGLLKKHFAYKDYPVDVVTATGIADTLRLRLTFKVAISEDGKVIVKPSLDDSRLPSSRYDSLPAVVSTPAGDFTLVATEYFPEGKRVYCTIIFEGYDAAGESLMEDIDFSLASKKSNVIEISMKTTDIDYARDVIDNAVRRYNIRCLDRKTDEGNRTLAFIDSRLALLADDLSASETETENYKKSQRIVDVAGEAEYQTLRKGRSEESLVEAETEVKILELARDFLSSPGNARQLIPASIESESLNDAVESYNKLILERMSLSRNARHGNRALASLDASIEAMRANILSSIERAYADRKVAVERMKHELGSARSMLGNIPSQEKQYRGLMRQQAVREKLYVFLLQRREETAMMIANSLPKGSVIDSAYALNEPLTMKPRYIYLIAMIIGLMITPAVIAVRAIARNKFSTVSELEKLTSLPVLGEICIDKSGRHLIVGKGEDSPAGELFRLIRAHLRFILPGNGSKTIVLTSTSSGEGKSFIAINLAQSIAMLNKRVLLVGADIRKPKLTDYLGLQRPPHGLTDLLANESLNPSDAITGGTDSILFDLMASGPIPPNPSELLMSPRLEEIFNTLRGIYDYIIVDSAPLGMVSDTFSLDRVADATLYVCRANVTTFADIDFINRIATEKKLRNIALILNATHTRRGYGYGYGNDR